MKAHTFQYNETRITFKIKTKTYRIQVEIQIYTLTNTNPQCINTKYQTTQINTNR